MSTLANILDELTVEGSLYSRLPDNAVRCFACGHRCLIREGKRGICQVRFNRGVNCACRGGMSLPCNLTRSKRSRSIMCCPARTH